MSIIFDGDDNEMLWIDVLCPTQDFISTSLSKCKSKINIIVL